MGTVYTELTLKNAGDVSSCNRGMLEESEIRQTTVTAVVDTGAGTLIIDEARRQQLGLEVRKEKVVTLANNEKQTVKIVDPVEIHWKDRSCTFQPWVVPNSPKTLLGAIPLEDMDLIVDPKKEEVFGRHGDEWQGYLLTF